MSNTTGVGDPMDSREHSSIAAFVLWMLAAGSVAFVVPWVTFYLEPNESSPWWSTWVPIGAWVLTATFGIALAIAGGRARRIGAALILGDAVGFGLFFASLFFYVVSHV